MNWCVNTWVSLVYWRPPHQREICIRYSSVLPAPRLCFSSNSDISCAKRVLCPTHNSGRRQNRSQSCEAITLSRADVRLSQWSKTQNPEPVTVEDGGYWAGAHQEEVRGQGWAQKQAGTHPRWAGMVLEPSANRVQWYLCPGDYPKQGGAPLQAHPKRDRSSLNPLPNKTQSQFILRKSKLKATDLQATFRS